MHKKQIRNEETAPSPSFRQADIEVSIQLSRYGKWPKDVDRL